MDAATFANMGKQELRAACREAQISYSKLDNAGMRAALEAAFSAPAQGIKPEPVAEVAETTPTRRSSDPVEESQSDPETDPSPTNVLGAMFGQLHLPMPVLAPVTSVQVIDGKRVLSKVTPHVRSRSTDVVVKTPAPERECIAHSGYKIEKEREEKNGVKRPSGGTTCAAIWTNFDTNPGTMAKNLDTIADSNNWDRTTVHVQFYVWRKFNGIKGRQS